MPTWIIVLLAVMVFLSSATGPTALLLQFVGTRREHRKSQDTLNEKKTDAQTKEQDNRDALAAAEAAAATEERKTQAALIEKLLTMFATEIEEQKNVAKAIDASTTEQKIGHGIEADRLASHDKEAAAWRTSIQDQTTAVVGFQAALAVTSQTVLQGVVQAKEAMIEAVAGKVDEMGNSINAQLEKSLSETKESVVVIQGLLEELIVTIRNTVLPVPDQYKDLRELTERVEKSLDTANGQLKLSNQQLSRVLNALAQDAAGGDTPQTDAANDANKKDDRDAAAPSDKP